MQPGGDVRPRRRTRTWIVVAAVVLVVLLVLGVVGLLGVRYVSGLIGAAGGSGFEGGSGEMLGEVDVAVERMDLTSTVAATGSLTAGRPLTLGFTGSGQVVAVDVVVGDRVVPGQVLARLDPRLAQLDLDAAEATLAAAERLAGASTTTAGAADARAGEARVAVASARTALAAAREVAGAETASLDSAVAAAGRQRDRDAEVVAAARAALAVAEAARTPPAARQTADAELAAARTVAATARADEVAAAQQVAAAVAAGDQDAERVASARQAAAAVAVGAADARVGAAQEVLDAADTTVAAADAARTEVAATRATADASAEAVVVAADARRTGSAATAQGVDGARSSLAQAEAALQVLLSGGDGGAGGGAPGGTSPEELQVAVDRARLDVETARTGLAGTTIVAPVAATVTAVDATVGTAAGAGSPAPSADGETGAGAASGGTVTLTATQALVAEVSVPETDAVRLEDGMPVELKFSAIPDVVGAGRVLTVVAAEPTAGAEQGFDPFSGQPAPAQKTYTVTVAVDELPPGARGGLSIAARITTGSSPDALVVPTAAVTQTDGRTTVLVVDGETVEEVEVDLGLRQGGFSEVVDGVEEGDMVRVADPMADPGTAGPGMRSLVGAP